MAAPSASARQDLTRSEGLQRSPAATHGPASARTSPLTDEHSGHDLARPLRRATSDTTGQRRRSSPSPGDGEGSDVIEHASERNGPEHAAPGAEDWRTLPAARPGSDQRANANAGLNLQGARDPLFAKSGASQPRSQLFAQGWASATTSRANPNARIGVLGVRWSIDQRDGSDGRYWVVSQSCSVVARGTGWSIWTRCPAASMSSRREWGMRSASR
jgi:hypothetical protein